MKKYDALYIFVGIVGGNVLEKVSLGRRSFSRPMGKRDSGVYVKVRMELDPAKVDELVNRYHLVEEVFRVQILAVDERREAKIAAERAARAERQASHEHVRHEHPEQDERLIAQLKHRIRAVMIPAVDILHIDHFRQEHKARRAQADHEHDEVRRRKM